jgi:hypothetical protein
MARRSLAPVTEQISLFATNVTHPVFVLIHSLPPMQEVVEGTTFHNK